MSKLSRLRARLDEPAAVPVNASTRLDWLVERPDHPRRDFDPDLRQAGPGSHQRAARMPRQDHGEPRRQRA